MEKEKWHEFVGFLFSLGCEAGSEARHERSCGQPVDSGSCQRGVSISDGGTHGAGRPPVLPAETCKSGADNGHYVN